MMGYYSLKRGTFKRAYSNPNKRPPFFSKSEALPLLRGVRGVF